MGSNVSHVAVAPRKDASARSTSRACLLTRRVTPRGVYGQLAWFAQALAAAARLIAAGRSGTADRPAGRSSATVFARMSAGARMFVEPPSARPAISDACAKQKKKKKKKKKKIYQEKITKKP
eukprot:NODE_24532_length_621_cov_1.995951.p2 GENE.NODE_24532_length_621_cov_1.995951~~NODE_24532_length_621_cov_1.995951.p2  ORF type:complete len:122 (-),score=33.26 NODE_24532_length_621_cov_1.995951:89-454(-)